MVAGLEPRCADVLGLTGRRAADAAAYPWLYCEALELGSGQKVWRAACVGCGSLVARVTRGEALLRRVAQGGGFDDYDQIADVVWHLIARPRRRPVELER